MRVTSEGVVEMNGTRILADGENRLATAGIEHINKN